MTDQNQQARNMTGSMANEAYEASVAARALARAGANPQLKGVAHELMFCDKFNFDPTHFLRGEHASLTKSATAQMKDIIMKNAQGRVIGHAQLKDTVSASVSGRRYARSSRATTTRLLSTERRRRRQRSRRHLRRLEK